MGDGKADDLHFYTASGSAFPHWGDWACIAVDGTELGSECDQTFCNELVAFGSKNTAQSLENALGGNGAFTPAVGFQTKECTYEVRLTAVLPATVEFPNHWGVDESCESAAAPGASLTSGFLGDRVRDIDEYLFKGEVGETITIMLNRDTSTGSGGDQARLTLRDQIAGAQVQETRTGLLPLQITVELPKSGTYLVQVAQIGERNSSIFKGNFVLSVASSSRSFPPLEPRQNVEP